MATIFDSISQKLDELIPRIVDEDTYKPAPQASEAIEKARITGEEIRQKFGTPIVKVAEKVPSITTGLFEAISRAAGALTQRFGLFKIPEKEQVPFKFDSLKTALESLEKQPLLGEVVKKGVERGPLKAIPGLPVVVGFLSEFLLPPYFGKGGQFIDDLARISGKAETKALLMKGLKDITEQEADNLAAKIAPIVDKNVIRGELKSFAKSKVEPVGREPGIERGFITSVKEELPQLKVAGQYIPRSTDELAIRARNLIKDDLAAAEKMALLGTDDRAVAVGAELLKHYSDEAMRVPDEIIKKALYEKAGDIAGVMAEKLTEQGRSIQAASILGRLTPEGQLRFAARTIQKYNEEVIATRGGLLGIRKQIPELTDQQTRNIINEMNVIQSMPEGTEKAMRFQKLQNFISDLVPTPLFKKIIAVWKAGLLTGLKTSGLNIFANISHFGSEVAKDIPATIIDRIAALFTGKRTMTFNIKGISAGAKEGFEKGLRYITTGFDERNIGAKLDYKRVNFGKSTLTRGLQAYTDTIFRIIGGEDQPFYYATKLRSFGDQAKAAAINKGLKGNEAQNFIDNLIQNPTEEMIRYATVDAETAVFQNLTTLGEAARSIQKIGGGAGEIIVPFGRTPSAVATQILNYSPIGIVKTLAENIGKGRFDQRLFAQGLGRGITGTVALYLGGLLFEKGLLNLARPSSEKERKLWEIEGRSQNSFYDPILKKWRSIQVLGPAGNLLIVGGYFKKEFRESGSPSEAMAKTLAGASLSFSQQTFLTGVSNFIDAVSDPTRSAENVAGGTLASGIPTIIADIARATDEKERRVNGIFDRFMARIPGIREKLEPQITVLGKEKETVGNPLEIMLDPTRPSPSQSTPVTQELRRLWDAGFKVSPTLLGDKKGYNSLTLKQNTELWKKAGEITNDKLISLFNKDEYLKLNDEDKSKIVENIISKSKLYARVGIVIELTNGLSGDKLKSRLSEFKKSGLLTQEVLNKYLELR